MPAPRRRIVAGYQEVLLLIAVLLLLTAVSARAQQQYTIRHFTTADGLVANQCSQFYIDRRGFAWVVTSSGISRFDGRYFTNYTTRNGLKENLVESIFEDDNGHLWVLTSTGVSLYTGGNPVAFSTFAPLQRMQDVNDFCPGAGDTVYYSYSQTPGLWYTTGGKEYRVPGYTEVSLTLARDKQGFIYSLSRPHTMTVVMGGRMVNQYKIPEIPSDYVVFDGQMPRQPQVQLRAPKYTLFCTAKPQGATIDTLTLADRPVNNLALYRSGDSQEVYCYGENTVWRRHRGEWDTVYHNAQPGSRIISMSETQEGNIWLCTYNGLVRLTRRLPTQSTLIRPDHYFRTDNTGRTALCTDSAAARNRAAVHLLEQQGTAINNIFYARDSAVWLCAQDNLYRVDKKGYTTTRRKAEGRYHAAIEDSAGRVWISNYAGVLCYDNGRYREYHRAEGVTENAIYSIAIDKRQTVYAGGTMVFALPPGSARFINITARLQLPYEFTMKLVAGPDGRVWLCQRKGRLLKIDYTNDGHFFVADSLELDINGTELLPMSIDFDGRGNLWVAGRNMVIYPPDANGRYDATRQIILPELLHDVGYPYLASDYKSTVALCYLPREGNTMESYPVSLVGTMRSRPVPSLYITDISLARMPQNWAAMGCQTDGLGVPKEPILKASQNFISINYTAIARNNPDAIAYRYRLTGLSDQWIRTNSQLADFTNLSPGDYSFILQADDGTGQWHGDLQYRFTILPPWYRTWWAEGAAMLLVLGIVFLIYHLRMRALRARARVERLVIEEQLRALRAQINPHFLQNSFDFLAHQVGRVSQDAAIETIHQISAYLRNVLYLSDEPVLTLEDELIFTKEYLDVQKMLTAHPFHYEIIVDDEADTYGTKVPSMLLQPIVENALKYGLHRHNENLITIKVREDNKYMYCSIDDTGSGETQAPKPAGYKSKGMLLTLNRMQLLYEGTVLKPSVEQTENDTGGWSILIKIPAK